MAVSYFFSLWVLVMAGGRQPPAEVRRLAGAMVPEMIHIYKSLGDVDSVASLFDFAFPVMYEAVQVEREIDAMVVLMDSLGAVSILFRPPAILCSFQFH